MPLDDADTQTTRPRADAPGRDEPRRPVTRPSPRHGEDDDSADAAKNGGDDEKGGGDQNGAKPADVKKKKRSARPWLIFGLVVIAAAIGGFFWWLSGKDLQSTDDAYTDGNALIIAPKISGYVTKVYVNDNREVKSGDTLIDIDPRDYITARDQARAQVATAQGQLDSARVNAALVRVTAPAKLDAARAQKVSAEATLTQRNQDYRRQTSISRAATTQQDVDQATSTQRQAAAGVTEADTQIAQAAPVAQLIAQADAQVEQVQGTLDQAKAQLAQAEVNLTYTKLVAPQDGTVTKRNVNQGNYVSAGTQVMSLVTPDIWVTANFKETELSRMRPGQPVDISVDAYPALKLKGRVDSVQLGSGSKFTAFPAENATGNYVKIVQRVPVKITITSGLDPALPLPLGISVEPTVSLK